MSYIVASPGRNGSIFLASILQQCLQNTKHKLYLNLDNNSKDDPSIADLRVLHSHIPTLISRHLNTHKLIIVKRNVVEMTGSHFLGISTATFHFEGAEREKLREDYIEKYQNTMFTIDQYQFTKKIVDTCRWYVEVNSFVENPIIFNYRQAIDNNSIFEILNLPKKEVISETLPQPFDKWSKFNNSGKLKDTGNKVFSLYQKKYPHIFTEEDFKY